MKYTDELIKLNLLFNKLREILIQEDEHNYIRGINVIINRMKYSLEYNEDAKATIKSVGDTYFFMNSGNGSFSDFFIWKEDFDERVESNKVLKKLRNDITSFSAHDKKNKKVC